ncbi:MAG: hypothetical protein RQ739_14665, partial [Desulfotignum sp.]|nr:hypothetical protein [Desulfotignum sp.]
MKSPKFLVMDSHWREYDQDATPKSWGIPSAGLAYIIASVKDQGGEIVGVEQFFTEKKDRPASIQDFFKIRDTFISKGIEKAINEHLFVKNGGYYRDGIGTDHGSAHANMMPLAFGIVPEAHKKNVAEYL